MGKVVKYCSSCDEGFAERFGFCPVCGSTLTAYEMNPVANDETIPEETIPVETAAAETLYETAATGPSEPVVFAGQIDEDVVKDSEPEEDEVPPTVAIPAAAAASSVFATPPMNADVPRAMHVTPEALDDGYYITVIEEKNGKQRNLLLLASAALCLTVALGATVWSIFDKALDVGAIDDGRLFSAVIVDDPMMTEEVQQEKKDKDKSGGGGGGGKEQPDPVNQGDLVDQTRHPVRPPDVNTTRMENPSLLLPPPSTEGDKKFAKNFDHWGDPNSKFQGLSNGPGSGGGIGTGVGTGQGSGRGTGTGSGSGSGYGSGNGDGNGDGDGEGGRGGPPPTVSTITTPLQIISKPKATYTDAARTNNVQGSVRLKITLLASGQVGSITPVTRLPHGLTEQAIAAARQIRFKPKMINGVAQSVVVTFDYGFNIY
jgi:TonB family protein